MCDFTPRPPAELPKSQWVSYKKLVAQFQPWAPTEVWQHGPGNLKQLITEWFKEDPAFAGWPLVVLVDDAREATRSTTRFLWTTFTRFDPASDLYAKKVGLAHHHALHRA